MNGPLIFGITVVVFAMIVVSKSAILVPEHSAYVVERLGRYDQTLESGFHVLVPFIDVVRQKHSLAEQTIQVAHEACRTHDDRQVWIAGAVALKIANPRKASYETADYRTALGQLARTVLRRQVAAVDLDRLHAERDAVSGGVATDLRAVAGDWGIAVLRYDMTDISRHNKETAA